MAVSPDHDGDSDSDEDCWDVFGDDDDSSDDSTNANETGINGNNRKEEDDDEDVVKACEEGSLYLTKQFLRKNSQITLKQRHVVVGDEQQYWRKSLEKRAFHIVSRHHDSSNGLVCDAAIIVNTGDVLPKTTRDQASRRKKAIVPGGILLCMDTSVEACTEILDARVWCVSEKETLFTSKEFVLMAIQKRACPINRASCPWKPTSTTLIENELSMVADATITRSAHELLNGHGLTENGMKEAVAAIQKYGYCVVRNLLDKDQCLQWGTAVVKDFDAAANILLKRDGVDLRHPHDSQNNPQNYREMAMREDLRVDLRDGPALRKLRQRDKRYYKSWNIDVVEEPPPANDPIITSSSGSPTSCLRFHSDVLEITKRTMNPKDSQGDELYKGNFGRYNFGGTGPDGSMQPLRIGPMGGILSLPGSADQAIHADTPHLFEHLDHLPAHYVNAFALGAHVGGVYDNDGIFTGSTSIGGTAFVHGSHKLSVTAKWHQEDSNSSLLGGTNREDMLRHVVRPSLQVGDVVLFDCRVLHFGLANTSKDVQRPLLYVNMTHTWFHDPKNWNNRKQIFTTNTA